jgi:hypothetical protein
MYYIPTQQMIQPYDVQHVPQPQPLRNVYMPTPPPQQGGNSSGVHDYHELQTQRPWVAERKEEPLSTWLVAPPAVSTIGSQPTLGPQPATEMP